MKPNLETNPAPHAGRVATRRSCTALWAFSSLALLLAACSSETVAAAPVEPFYAADLAEADWVADGALYTAAAPYDPFIVVAVSSVIAPASVSAAANGAARYFQPTGCATAGISGDTVTYVLNNCKGPLGISRMRGSVIAALSHEGGGIKIAAHSTDLVTDTGNLSIALDAVYLSAGNQRTLKFNNKSTASTARGTATAVDESGTLGWSKGDPCVTRNAAGTVSVNGASYTKSVTDVVHCMGKCPASGSLALSRAGGGSVTLIYNGSSDVPYTQSNGGSGTVALRCGE